jgi:hypothetical protein
VQQPLATRKIAMAIRDSDRDIAAQLRSKARQYRVLASSVDNRGFADLAIKISHACDARAAQIENNLVSRVA